MPVTGPPDVASGPVAASGVSALVWIASGLAVVLGLAGVAAAVAVSRRGRRPTPSGRADPKQAGYAVVFLAAWARLSGMDITS